jgi:hypothetical protein
LWCSSSCGRGQDKKKDEEEEEEKGKREEEEKRESIDKEGRRGKAKA